MYQKFTPPVAVGMEAEMMMAVSRIRQSHLDRLRALGCMGKPVVELGTRHAPFGAMRVQRRSGMFYEPDEAGASAIIIPVCWPEYHEGLFTPLIITWPIVDLIAFQLSRPANWLWRRGVGWALGGHLVEEWRGEPIHVVATPLEWLRCGGNAMCVLDWADHSPVWPLLRHIPSFVVSDDMLAHKLGQAVERAIPRPTIMVTSAKGRMRHHAA